MPLYPATVTQEAASGEAFYFYFCHRPRMGAGQGEAKLPTTDFSNMAPLNREQPWPMEV